jgi:hypothetical protein
LKYLYEEDLLLDTNYRKELKQQIKKIDRYCADIKKFMKDRK